MENYQNDNPNQNSPDRLDPKTNEDYNKKQPDPKDPNQKDQNQNYDNKNSGVAKQLRQDETIQNITDLQNNRDGKEAKTKTLKVKTQVQNEEVKITPETKII